MKPVKLLMLLLCVCALTSSFMAEAADTKKIVYSGTQIILQRHGGRYPNKRPNAPSRQMIVCAYDGDAITMSFAIPEGLCEVYLTNLNTGQTSSYSVDSSELSATFIVGTIEDSSIEVITEYGNSYCGILSDEEYNNQY